jgi:prepilin-type N-terminal cleavage/methylation domain-containing protein
MKTAKFSHQQGFNLLEVLISLFIISTGIFALAPLQSEIAKDQGSSANLTSALFLAEAKIEQLKSEDFNSLTDGQENDINGLAEPEGIFTRTWTINDYLGDTSIKQILVTVSWTDNQGSHQYPLETLVSLNQ